MSFWLILAIGIAGSMVLILGLFAGIGWAIGSCFSELEA
jgi:hypothetical protein